jgi:hypothetical protein
MGAYDTRRGAGAARPLSYRLTAGANVSCPAYARSRNRDERYSGHQPHPARLRAVNGRPQALLAMAEIEDNVDRELFRNVEKLRALRIEHRDLDEVISRLTLDIHSDQLQLKRLKKRKLMLKDQITRMESELIPDLNA